MDKTYRALGLMSGSSLDGLDIAYCTFSLEQEAIQWQIVQSHTLPYSSSWQDRLAQLPQASARDYAKTHLHLGQYFGQLCRDFLQTHKLTVDFIASHGHTIFHEPEEGYTAQVGDGAAIAAAAGIPTIDQFRIQDICLGGQGAPIAPIADQYLLPGYDFYLNLGGIVNISARVGDSLLAFDISGANQVLNRLAAERGLDFDAGGALAASGTLLPDLLEASGQAEYFGLNYPKSLSNQWVQEQLVSLFLQHPGKLEDKLCTMNHHIAQQIQQSIHQLVRQEELGDHPKKMIATGGGAHNDFMVELIQQYNPNLSLEIPDREIIEFKEAAMIALMGVLRMEQRPNTIPSVTGAQRATVSGAIHAGHHFAQQKQ